MRQNRHRPGWGRPELGLIGAGAFGAFAIPHLARDFDVVVHDPRADLPALAPSSGVRAGSLAEAARSRVVVLAVPLAALGAVATAIAPHLGRRALVVDTCSVKMRPLALLRAALPPSVRVVGTHPLFGPQSGRDGISGLQIAVCPGDLGSRSVARFLERKLALRVVAIGAEDHDREMAHVQGLSHLVARGLMASGLPELALATAASTRLREIVALLGSDSDALLDTIIGANPFAAPILRRFLSASEALVARATSA